MYEQKTIKTKKITSIAVVLLFCVLSFICGIFTANSKWFNNIFYIKSRQMETLYPKSVYLLNNTILRKAETQADMNNASYKIYDRYHKYYEKVVKRIKKYDFHDESTNKSVINYLNGHEKRKSKMLHLMFPDIDNPKENEYGSMFPFLYYSTLQDIDNQELLTYKMILRHIYSFAPIQDIDTIFAD